MLMVMARHSSELTELVRMIAFKSLAGFIAIRCALNLYRSIYK